jgi:hypothetical protein
MMLRTRRAAFSILAVCAVCGCGGAFGSDEEGTVSKSDAELAAIAADQQIREAELLIRAMRPEERDLTPLLKLLGTDLREGAIAHYTVESSWPGAYEVDGQIDVVRQTTRVISEDEVVVASCELDWLNMIHLNGEMSSFRGTRAAPRAVSRTFRKSPDGVWVNVSQQEDFEICSGVPVATR